MGRVLASGVGLARKTDYREVKGKSSWYQFSIGFLLQAGKTKLLEEEIFQNTAQEP